MPTSSSHPLYDIVILGAGPGGLNAALSAALKGRRVALINGGHLVGYGLEGAYKSKSMYEIARSHHAIQHKWNLAEGGYNINYKAMHATTRTSTQALRTVHSEQLKRLGVDLITGLGRFVDPHTIEVNEKHIRGQYIIIATGTRPRMLPHIHPEPGVIFTSDDVVNLDHSIESILVLGAGVIGCEFASIFAALGTHVTLIDSKERIFSHDDADISGLLQRKFEELGVTVHPSSRCKTLEVQDGVVRTELSDGTVLTTQTALLAVGRSPNTSNIGLDVAGLKTDAYGYIPTSDSMQTSVPHIYAVGDVGLRDSEHDLCLVHIAEAEGRTAIGHICGDTSMLSTDYVPFLIFTLPMVAGAGYTEHEARKRFGDVRIGKWAHIRNHRAHAMQCPSGFVKLIVAPEGDDRVLGVRAIGDGVDTIVGEVAVLIQHNLPYTHLLETTHPHPCLSESLKGAAMLIAGSAPPYIPEEEFAEHKLFQDNTTSR